MIANKSISKSYLSGRILKMLCELNNIGGNLITSVIKLTNHHTKFLDITHHGDNTCKLEIKIRN